MSSTSSRRQIYERLVAHSAVFALEGPWGRFADDAGVRRVAPTAVATLPALLADFSGDALCQAGVAIRELDHALALHPALANPNQAFLPLHEKPEDAPYDLLIEGGTVSGSSLPVCAVLADAWFQIAIPAIEDTLCVAFSMTDVAALLAAGIPATLATGLDQLRDVQLDEFCRCCGINPRVPSPSTSAAAPIAGGASPAANAAHLARKHQRAECHAPGEVDGNGEPFPPYLLLVAWSPGQLDLAPPEGLPPVLSHLQCIHKHLGIRLDETGTWRPTADELERVKFCLQVGTRAHVHEALRGSMTKSVASLIDRPRQPGQAPLPPKDFAAAQAQLLAALRQGKPRDQLIEAWQTFARLLESDLIKPLIGEATRAAKPLDQNLWIAAADISRMLHSQALLSCSKLCQGIRAAGLPGGGMLPLTEIQQVLALTDRLLALNRELSPRHPKRT